MRHIERLSKPNILVEKEKEWMEKFIASDKPRPDNSKYGHKEIHNQLLTQSHNKCYYCEVLLKGTPKEIDHNQEVASVGGKELAFAWDNLFLSCTHCNDKLPHKDIPVGDVLNPCVDSDEEIEKHITFEDEHITFNSHKGEKTIIKLKLSSEVQDSLRRIKLTEFHKELLKIKDNQLARETREMTDDERYKLQIFARKDRPYSMMFRLILSKYGL